MARNPRSSPAGPRASETAPAPGGGRADAGSDPLFRHATAPETLRQAWARVEANHGAAGGDGVTVERFAFFVPAALDRLSERLRGFTYRPGPARRVNVPKKSGGLRPLDIPCVIDRVAQGAAVLALQPVLEPEMEDSSFAYRPGRGVADAVRRIAALRRDGFTHVVDGDISRYFENVPHEMLLSKLERATGDDAILDLVALWLEWYAPAGKGLPQGSPLSPLLANLYLDAVDEAIARRGVRLVRYADDFVLLARSEAAAEGVLTRMTALLAEHGLELHPDKTRVVSFERGFRFLGHLFVRSFVLKEMLDDTPAEDAIGAAEAAIVAAAAGTEPPAPSDEADAGAGPRGPYAPGQRVLYLLEPGRRLAAEADAFAVTEADAPILRLPHRRVDRIEVGEGVAIEVGALDLAAASETEICRVNGHGETVGRWTGPALARSHARRHLAQAATALDPARRLELARILVAGRIRNQRAVLHRVNRARKDPDTVLAAARMMRILRRLRQAESVDEAMGFEGEAGRLYWPALKRALEPDLGFTGQRRRRPAGSPMDAVLNALVSLLARDVRIALVRHGLHPGLSVLHVPEDGEDALVYDLMEEFRAPLAEATAVALVNRRAVEPGMFALMSTGHWRMDRDAWRAIIRGYEAAAARPVASPRRGGDRASWRAVMQHQAAALAAHFEGRETYRPYPAGY